MDLPHTAKRACGDQMGPIVPKVMSFGSPPHQGLKTCGLSIKIFYVALFLGPAGVLSAGFTLLAMFLGWYSPLQFWAHQEG